MNRIKAVTLNIGELDQPVITKYQLGVIVHKIYCQKKYKGKPIKRLQKEFAENRDFNDILSQLLHEGILKNYKGFRWNTVYSILGRKHKSSEDIACTVDPFCYVSHLSAMDHHGLTDRIPRTLHVSSPSPKEWKIYAQSQMAKDIGEHIEIYILNRLPDLTRISIKKIGNQDVYRFSNSHMGAFKNIKGRTMRVTTIGRTFLDMLRQPELCGGINHVLEVFQERAKEYQKVIVDEVDQNGNPIDKVRAGYILDERLSLNDKKIDEWLGVVQRGGSRKLDSSEEYEPIWSEKWCLSINI